MKRHIAVVAVALCALATLSHAQESQPPEAVLAEQIDSLRTAGRYSQALALAEELLDLRRARTDVKQHQLGDSERMVATLRAIASLPADAQRELMTADNMAGTVDSLYYEDAYEDAAAVLRSQLEIRRRHLGDEDAAVATTMNNLGFMLDMAGEYEEAEEMYRGAVEIDRRVLGDAHPGLATELDNLAVFLSYDGRADEAKALNREALAIFERVGEPSEDFASALSTLAGLYKDEGDYAAAEPPSRRALAMMRRVAGDDSPDTALQLNELGDILARKGDYVGAEQHLREAIDIYKKADDADPCDYGIALNNLATAYHDQDNLAAAEPLYSEAIEMARACEDDEEIALRLNNYADLLHDQRKYDQSEPMYRESLAMHRALFGDAHPRVATVLTMLARDLRDQGRTDEAEPIYQEALAMYRDFLGDAHPHIAMCLYSYSRCLEQEGDFDAALPLLEEAASVFEVARERAGVGMARATFQKAPYPLLANALLELDQTEKAWPAVEKQRGRLLSELIIVTRGRKLSPEENEAQEALLSTLTDLEHELAAYRSAALEDPNSEDAERTAECRNALLDAEAQWAAMQNELARKYPLSAGRTFSMERVRASMPNDAAIVGWLDVEVHKGQPSSWVYVVPKTGTVTWARLSRDSDESAFRAAVAARESSRIGLMRDARAIWEKRFAPVEDALAGVRKLIVIPSGPMLGVPVDAVVDGEGRYLADRFDISCAPSATLFAWLNEQSRTADLGRDSNVLLVGDPPFSEAQVAEIEEDSREDILDLAATDMPDAATLRDDKRSALAGNAEALARLPRLRGARVELNHLRRLFQRSTTLAGVGASEQSLHGLAAGDALAQYEIVHVATHALVDDRRPERSALVLSQVGLPDPLESATAGKRIHDGLVTASEVMREWNLDADLVTLSACETALGRRVSGEGYIGLAHAFLSAGARTVVVSLWKVDDRASSLLMKRFYENLVGARDGAAPMTKAAALGEAKAWLRGLEVDGSVPFEHPYFWSAFVLIGDRG